VDLYFYIPLKDVMNDTQTFTTILFVFVIFYCILFGIMSKRPPYNRPFNAPQDFLLSLKKKSSLQKTRILFIGDSITHGLYSANYVNLVAEHFGKEKYDFINAGINGDLTWNVNQRIKEIIQCQPQVITILIGTNDANGAFNEENQRSMMKLKHLPQLPTMEFFDTNLRELIRRLQSDTNAKIGILSIPPIGEDLKDPIYEQTKQYSQKIQQIAKEYNVQYIPLFETIDKFLVNHPIKQKVPFSRFQITIVKAELRIIWFKTALNKISESNGFYLHTDHFHMNLLGAQIIKEVLIPFLDQKLNI